jgi:hypothetical protein
MKVLIIVSHGKYESTNTSVVFEEEKFETSIKAIYSQIPVTIEVWTEVGMLYNSCVELDDDGHITDEQLQEHMDEINLI